MRDMKRVLVLGVGLQGKAVIHDLDRGPGIGDVVAMDLDVQGGKEFAARTGLKKVRFLAGNALDDRELGGVIERVKPDAVVCMLPPAFAPAVARVVVDCGVSYISSSYTGKLAELDEAARERGVTILPEMGMDPGIDLLLAKAALSELDEARGMRSYGFGLPEPDSADNPLRYKITWTFDGVLRSYVRPARFLENGREISVPGTEIFREENIHRIDVAGLGELEAYPNGDSMHYKEVFGLGDSVTTMARYAARYPGHCRFWSVMADLGLLDEKPVDFGGANVSPHDFLVRHLGARLNFRPEERDVVIVRIHAWGVKNGKGRDVVMDLTDYRDLSSGLFAMNRTVGYTTSIAAQMVLSGEVAKRGVLSPVRDVPIERFLDELQARGMIIDRRVAEC